MESLSQEILALIITHFFGVPPMKSRQVLEPEPVCKVSPYAIVSHKWQNEVERYTMAKIQIYSADLGMFRQVFSSPRRRSLLRKLRYEIDLPTYSRNRIHCLETRRESKANNVAFTQGVMDLFNELSSWETEGIVLGLSASSPMDPGLPFDIGRRPEEFGRGLAEKRWRFKDNYLLLDLDFLPQCTSIEALVIQVASRSLHPSAIGKIIASLPRLDFVTIDLDAPKAKRVEMQDEHRQCLVDFLHSPALSNLQTLNINITQGIIHNHSFRNRLDDPNYPNGDSLSVAIRRLAENTRLKTLNLTGTWPVSPALFNGQNPFPYLEKVHIEGAPMTYDGRWYYTGNPSDVEASHDNTRYDEADADSDSDSNSSFNSEVGDSLPEGREALLNGFQPLDTWRTRPDPQTFDPLMKSAATAALRMPSLKSLYLSIEMVSKFSRSLTFEFLKPGERAWADYHPPRSAQRNRTRCYMTLSSDVQCTVPTDITDIWEKLVGNQGVISIESS